MEGSTSSAFKRRSRLSALPSSPSSPLPSINSSPQHLSASQSRPSRLSRNIQSPFPSSPSLSASTPFDWEAARGHKPPPFGYGASTSPGTTSSGLSGRRLRKPSFGTESAPRKRVIRRDPWYKRMMNLPSRVMFELSLFPHNLPLPKPKTLGRAIGGFLHFLHLLCKWYGRSQVQVKEDQWEDWMSEVEGSWSSESRNMWSWATLLSVLLFTMSMLNTLYLFTRIRAYHLYHRPDLVHSGHASLVSKEAINPPAPPTLFERILKLSGQAFRTAWRLIFGSSQAPEDTIPLDLQPGSNKVQQLDVWFPGDLEMSIFTVYSPAHYFVWVILSATNWYFVPVLMGILSLQLHALIFSYEALIKDRAILSAEVMHEYDVTFVNPRLNGIKCDASVQTNEAEMVDLRVSGWRKYAYT